MIHVVNKSTHTQTENDVYVGRGSALGNPFTHESLDKTKAEFKCSTRDEAIDSYRNYILERIAAKDQAICTMLNAIYKKAKKGDVYLVCYCFPLNCHGFVIKEIVQEKITQWVKKKLNGTRNSNG